MFKVTHGWGESMRVVLTCDELALAEEEALAYSRSLPRWGLKPEECGVQVRDVRDTIVRTVNWFKIHPEEA